MKGLLLISCLINCLCFVLGAEECPRAWKKVGCYRDHIIPSRPFPIELLNQRDVINKHWGKHLTNWTGFPQSLHDLACKCAILTKEHGYRYFGLQFYSECWSGPSLQYDRDGPSQECIGNDFKPCANDSNTECVGKAFTNFVYDTFIDTSIPDPAGWSEWTQWSACSVSCGGGVRERGRSCVNQGPSSSPCKGNRTEEDTCNMDICVPVCQNKVDIAIITDASTSVTSQNYLKVKAFVAKLSDAFDVEKDKSHFAMIHYSWSAHLDFNFADEEFWDPTKLKNKIMSSRYIYGGTRTDLALKMAEEKVFCTTCGIRSEVPKVLVVITDGKSSSPVSLREASQPLKDKAVTIISLGIGSRVDRHELSEIASDNEHVFVVDDFEDIVDRLNNISKLSCNAKDPFAGHRMIEWEY